MEFMTENNSAISPEGTAESSPGRQSWVYIPTETSPAGTTENAPGRQSWVNPDRTRMLLAIIQCQPDSL